MMVVVLVRTSSVYMTIVIVIRIRTARLEECGGICSGADTAVDNSARPDVRHEQERKGCREETSDCEADFRWLS